MRGRARTRHDAAREPEQGGCKHEYPKALPPECKHELDTTPQGNPNKGECKPNWPPQEPLREDVLSTWEGQVMKSEGDDEDVQPHGTRVKIRVHTHEE